ncbi:MAG: hypothetical protein H8E40_16040 [Chloroflexi bacterium]|nr:hypothetical protein [Chloroflexota bacterium]MBL7062424.1 hypothetical protein [Dehalococcoidia bacterium]
MRSQSATIKLTIDCSYHRNQFDDCLAGGEVEYRSRTYYWSAENSNYGFGWEIEPIPEENWSDISQEEFNEIIKLIEKCLYEHRTEYVS